MNDDNASSKRPLKQALQIEIDPKANLVFTTEDSLLEHFRPSTDHLEAEFLKLRDLDEDFSDEEQESFNHHLDLTVEDPDEIWEDGETIGGSVIYIYIRFFADEEDWLAHVAICYLTDGAPSFIYLHFATRREEMVEAYRRGRLFYDRVTGLVPKGALEGDALHEGETLANGLYLAMMKLRSEKDLGEERFSEFMALRELCLKDADEIWRSSEGGVVLVSFIKDFQSDSGEELSYVVVTQEDSASSSHTLLFSFPTNDISLVDRYRHGENLQAEEVIQESTH